MLKLFPFGQLVGPAWDDEGVGGGAPGPAPVDVEAQQPEGTPVGSDASLEGAPGADEDEDDALVESATNFSGDYRERVQQLANALKRQKKANKKLQEEATGYRVISRQAQANPHLRALLEGKTPGQQAPPQQQRPQVPGMPRRVPFNERDLPFNPNENETNRYFADLARRAHELEQNDIQNRYALRVLGNAYQGDRTQTIRSRWQATFEHAVKQVPEEARTAFNDIYWANAQAAARQGFTPEKLAAHYLAMPIFRPRAATGNGGTVVSRAGQAQRNMSLPRPGALSGGAPVSANADRSKDRIADAHRNARARLQFGLPIR